MEKTIDKIDSLDDVIRNNRLFGVADMDFRQLATFVEVAKQLNFTKASATLGYAQSTVTIHIQTLEEELKTQLFERIGKQIKLTGDGRQFYAYAERLLNLSNEAKEVVSSSASPKGVVELGTAESLCIYRLSDVLIDFRALYPDVEVKIRFDTSDDFYQHLRKNLVDVAIVLDNRCVVDDIVTHVLSEEPMVVIAAPGHPLTRKKRVLPSDLQGQPLILTEEGCSYHILFESILLQAKVRPGAIMSISSLEVIKKFVAHNWGLGFLPRATAEAEVAAGKLSVLAWAGPTFSVTSQLLYHKGKWISPALRAFIDFTLQRLQVSQK